MGNTSSELQASLTQILTLYAQFQKSHTTTIKNASKLNETLSTGSNGSGDVAPPPPSPFTDQLQVEIQNIVASIPLSLEISEQKLPAAKFCALMLDLLQHEYKHYRYTQGSNILNLILLLNAFTRLLKIRAFYEELPKHNITILVDLFSAPGHTTVSTSTTNDTASTPIKSAGPPDLLLTQQCCSLLSYLVNCRVTFKTPAEAAAAESTMKVAFAESRGYDTLIAVLLRYLPTVRYEENWVLQQQESTPQQNTAIYELIAQCCSLLSLELIDHIHTSKLIVIQRIVQLLSRSWEQMLTCTIHCYAPLRLHSLLLLQGFLMHTSPDRVQAIQNRVLFDGYVLYYILYAVQCTKQEKDLSQLVPVHLYNHASLPSLSRNLLSILTLGHKANIAFLMSAIPPALQTAILNEFKATEAQSSVYTAEASSTVEALLAKNVKAKSDKEFMESTLHYAISTGKLNRTDWNLYFNSLDLEQRTAVLIWGKAQKAEFVQGVWKEIEELNVVWKLHLQSTRYHYSTFFLSYASLQHFLKIGNYYVAPLLKVLQRNCLGNNDTTDIASFRTPPPPSALYVTLQQDANKCVELQNFVYQAMGYLWHHSNTSAAAGSVTNDDGEEILQLLHHRIGVLRILRLIYTEFGEGRNFASPLIKCSNLDLVGYLLRVIEESKDGAEFGELKALHHDYALQFLLLLLFNTSNAASLSESAGVDTSTVVQNLENSFHGLQCMKTMLTKISASLEEVEVIEVEEATSTASKLEVAVRGNTQRKRASYMPEFIHWITGVTQTQSQGDGSTVNAGGLTTSSTTALATQSPTVVPQTAANDAKPADAVDVLSVNVDETDTESMSAVSGSSTISTSLFAAASPYALSSGEKSATLSDLASDLLPVFSPAFSLLDTAERSLAILILLSRINVKAKKWICKVWCLKTLSKDQQQVPALFIVLARLLTLPPSHYLALQQVALQFVTEILEENVAFIQVLPYTQLVRNMVYWCLEYGSTPLPQIEDLLTRLVQHGNTELNLYFPAPLCKYFATHGSSEFFKVILDATDPDSSAIAQKSDPTLLWTNSMKTTLYQNLRSEILPEVQQYSKDPLCVGDLVAKVDTVRYPQLDDVLCISNLYLSPFNQQALAALDLGTTSFEAYVTLDSNEAEDLLKGCVAWSDEKLQLFTSKKQQQTSIASIVYAHLATVLQTQILLAKRYPSLHPVTHYKIKSLVRVVQEIRSKLQLSIEQQVDANTVGQTLITLEKAVELMHTLLPLNAMNYSSAIFEVKGLDLVINSFQDCVRWIEAERNTSTNNNAGVSYIPTLYYLLHTLALLCAHNDGCLKFMENTPSFTPLLLSLLSLKTWATRFPNATMATYKCVYTFAQYSLQLRSMVVEEAGLSLLVQLIMFYDAPAFLKYRRAVGVEKNQNHAQQASEPNGDASTGSKPVVDWTHKIRLGGAYVLQQFLKSPTTIPGASSTETGTANATSILQQLLGNELVQQLSENPSEFTKRIMSMTNSNEEPLKTIKAKVERELNNLQAQQS